MCPKPSNSFGIILNGSLITDLPVAQKDMLGIDVSQVPVPGIISMYEEHTVRTERGYTINQWDELDPRERALEVAVFRIKTAIEYQKNKAQEREMERNNRRR